MKTIFYTKTSENSLSYTDINSEIERLEKLGYKVVDYKLTSASLIDYKVQTTIAIRLTK